MIPLVKDTARLLIEKGEIRIELNWCRVTERVKQTKATCVGSIDTCLWRSRRKYRKYSGRKEHRFKKCEEDKYSPMCKSLRHCGGSGVCPHFKQEPRNAQQNSSEKRWRGRSNHQKVEKGTLERSRRISSRQTSAMKDKSTERPVQQVVNRIAIVCVTVNLKEISQESVSKIDKFCCCNGTGCVFLICDTKRSGIQPFVTLDAETNGLSCNKSHNFGFVFNGTMQLNERQNPGVFVIFIEPEARGTNSFVDGCVGERSNKFSCGNFCSRLLTNCYFCIIGYYRNG